MINSGKILPGRSCREKKDYVKRLMTIRRDDMMKERRKNRTVFYSLFHNAELMHILKIRMTSYDVGEKNRERESLEVDDKQEQTRR